MAAHDGRRRHLDTADAIALQKDKRVFWDYIDESAVKDTGEALVKCYFSAETAAEDMRAVREELDEMRERGRGYLSFGTLETSQREAESDEWAEIWKKHFRPLHIGSPHRRAARVGGLHARGGGGGRAARFEHGVRHGRA